MFSETFNVETHFTLVYTGRQRSPTSSQPCPSGEGCCFRDGGTLVGAEAVLALAIRIWREVDEWNSGS